MHFMVKPLQLNRLPKAGRLRTIRFRRTTPGNFDRLLVPHTENGANNVLDPSHPWASQHPFNYIRKLPSYQSPFLTIHLFPNALLGHHDTRHPFGPPFEPPAPKTEYGKDGKVKNGSKTLNMSLKFLASKKMHKSAVIRGNMKRKIKSALHLIVTRDAAVEIVDGKETIVTTESNNGEQWVLQDWTYVFNPNLEIYCMPLTTLFRELRQALTSVNEKARKLEYVWRLEAIKPQQASISTSKSKSLPRSGIVQNARQEEEKEQTSSVDMLSRVKALLRPYASSVELLDDDLLIEDDPPSHQNAAKSSRRKREVKFVKLHEASKDETNEKDEGQRESGEASQVYKGPSVLNAMYSKQPILKPMVPLPKEKPHLRRR